MSSLAGPDPEKVKEFVIAGHGNLPRVREMLEGDPSLLNAAQPWSETDRETAIQAAAQVGARSVAEYLLEKGAPLEICTAAMLARPEAVKQMLEADPAKITATGAHGIPLLTHAAIGGDAELVKFLWEKGARKGATAGLLAAIPRRRADVTEWLLENASPDLTAKDFRGKTALALAMEAKDARTEALLRAKGAA